LLLQIIGVSILGATQTGNQAFGNLMSGTAGILSSILAIILAGIILVGAVKMKRLENYGLAMAASIIAMLPCSLCCIAGLPIGIWSLVVLSKPEVKSAFH
jgi:sorbitol-specific phosphotransferase system component IIC